jgi:hypothetical protein
MLRIAFFLILGLLTFQKVTAQTERDAILYYMKNSGVLAKSKDSHGYRVLLPECLYVRAVTIPVNFSLN